MRRHLTWPDRLHAHALPHPLEDGRLHQAWDLNRGLVALSSILVVWLLLALMTLGGLSGLSNLPWLAG